MKKQKNSSGHFPMITLVVGMIVVALDQATKMAVWHNLAYNQSVSVVSGFFNLHYLRNTGAVWGIFQYQSEWLALFSCVALIMLAIFYRWLVDERGVHRLALGLMVGGITGNLIDRVKWGWVIDFIDLHWQTWHWPAFNIADAAICCGVLIFLLSSFKRRAHQADFEAVARP